MNSTDRHFIVRLGHRIRTLREEKGVDQKQFAFDCGMSRTQLHLIEKGQGNPRLVTLLKIAENLEMNLALLCATNDA